METPETKAKPAGQYNAPAVLALIAAELERHAARHDGEARSTANNAEKQLWHRQESSTLRARAAELRNGTDHHS